MTTMEKIDELIKLKFAVEKKLEQFNKNKTQKKSIQQ